MITACVVILPDMRPVLDCFIEGLSLKSSLITKVLVAVRTQEDIKEHIVKGNIQIEFFPFWFDRGPTPAGNTQWRGRGYSHAIGLHKCLERVSTDYVLLTEPDVIFIKKDFDKLFVDVINQYDVSITGVTRAADPRGYSFFLQQSIGSFPTVIASLVKMQDLPPAGFLKGKLKLRPHAFPQGNTDENSYENLDGAWLLQTAIPEFMDQFPNPGGEYPVGCNLYLWFKYEKWLSFHRRQEYTGIGLCNSTTYNLNNFGLSNTLFNEEPLLYHSGHGGIENLRKCLGEIR